MRYLRAREQQDWAVAMASYQSLVAPARQALSNDAAKPEEGDWTTLDQRMLSAVSYRGFERSFAVIFWFILLGPAGALLYRLSALYVQFDAQHAPSEHHARRWLWLLEWPAARVLGLSFALTGNFVGCIRKSRHHLWSTEEPTAEVLANYVLGALQVDETLPASLETVERELNLTLSLFSRTLIFWLCVLAVLAVLL